MKLLEAGAKQPGGGRSRGGRSRAWQRSRRHWLAFRLLAMAATLIEAKLPAASTAELAAHRRDSSLPSRSLTTLRCHRGS